MGMAMAYKSMYNMSSPPWVSSDSPDLADSISSETDLKMCRLSQKSLYYTTRLSSIIAPWPEPPSPISNKTFEFFRFLPASLRKKIWTFALPGPRVIEIHYANKQHGFRSQLPILLRVNREARSVVLTHYGTPTASPHNDLNSALGHHNLTYLNFERDTFCPMISFRSFITGEWKTFLRTLPNCERIQRFGLPKRCFFFPTPACIPLILLYSSLREVVVLADPCIDHHPQKDGKNEKRWCLDAGEVLPTLQEFDDRKGKEEVLDRYAVAYMDKVREAWRETHEWDLRFVYKRICWGERCWEAGSETRSEALQERQDGRERREQRARKAVRRVMGYPRRGVAKVMMLLM